MDGTFVFARHTNLQLDPPAVTEYREEDVNMAFCFSVYLEYLWEVLR